MTITPTRLPRLTIGDVQIKSAWNKAMLQIEGQIDAINVNIQDILTAQSTATSAARELARINSYTDPTVVLAAADAGTDATITIADHARVYPVQGTIDVPDVAIMGGTITGRAFSTQYAVYYDDTTLADTTPAYVSTTDLAAAQVGSAAGRHFVGVITTPADGGGATGGDGGSPPGGGGGFPLP